MTPARALPPLAGAPTPVRFPPIARDALASGLRVWSLPWTSVPVVTVVLMIDAGAAQDPPAQPGLASLTADLVDEGAGGRDAVQISDAFARLGTHLEVDSGSDLTLLSFTTLARNLDPALALLADIVVRPHLAEADLARVRDLRVSRLRQIKMSPGAAADRAFLEGIFGTHPYGHGTLGTTRMLESTSLEDVRQFHDGMFSAEGATLIVAGAVPAGEVMTSARAHFGGWRGRPGRRQPPPPRPPAPLTWRLVDRPGAPQSELRIGHLGPSRKSPAYHAMVVLNAALGGQFTSRINLQLREKKGFTYGARTSVDYRRTCSTFACETSVQSDATIEAIADVLAEFRAVGSDRPAAGDELARAQASLTRGYVRQFETAAQLARAAIELAKFHLPDGTFDAFVPRISAVTAADTLAAAHASVQPEACVVAIVGDAGRFREGLSEFQRTVVEVIPEF